MGINVLSLLKAIVFSLMAAFSQQLIHLALVIIPECLFVCPFPVSLLVQVFLHFQAPPSRRCS